MLEALRAETVAAMKTRLDAPAGPLANISGAKSSVRALDALMAQETASIGARLERLAAPRKTAGPTPPVDLC